MRLRKSRLKLYHLKHLESKKDSEGSSYEEYGDPLPFLADIQPAGGKIQAEMYGQKLAYMLNMICGVIEVYEGDGICVYVSENKAPDYKIVSIRRYDQIHHPHMICELEKI